jgi:DNA-binding beta-propeller fold protein YncE
VVAERLRRLDFRDPHTMRLGHALAVPCRAVPCRRPPGLHRRRPVSAGQLRVSGQLLWVDVRRERVAGVVRLEPGSLPQDVKLAPDGQLFYVADMRLGGVHLVAPARPRLVGFLRDRGWRPRSVRQPGLAFLYRYASEVYAIDTRSGALLARIRVGKGPHGLCVYPQPGRHSLGHTGVFR